MNYKLELESEAGNNQVWVIRGLEAGRGISEGYEDPLPDYRLWLVGMEESCDTAESIMRGVHSALYSLLQTDERLLDGDTFESSPCVANKFLNWSSDFGTFQIPAMRFVCRGVHVVSSTEEVATV